MRRRHVQGVERRRLSEPRREVCGRKPLPFLGCACRATPRGRSPRASGERRCGMTLPEEIAALREKYHLRMRVEKFTEVK